MWRNLAHHQKRNFCGDTLKERGNVILARAQCIVCFVARLNEMLFHQLYDSYESYELTRARVDLDLTVMRCSFHQLHDLYDSYELTRAFN